MEIKFGNYTFDITIYTNTFMIHVMSNVPRTFIRTFIFDDINHIKEDKEFRKYIGNDNKFINNLISIL